MSSSAHSSSLSTPEKMITNEVEEEMDQVPIEEQEEEEFEENENDEEMEENIQNESVYKDIDSQPSKLDDQLNITHPQPQRQQRKKKIYNIQKVLGTTILPVARVTRAAKQDKDIKIVSKEAVFLISVATEFFVKKLTDSAFDRSRRDKRVFVKYNDIAMAVKGNPEYDWLEEVIPTSSPLGKILLDPTIPSASTTLTNKLPTEALNQSTPTLPVNPISPIESNSQPVLDHMDINDDDELDEDI